MNPKQILEWIGDKVLLVVALILVAFEFMFDFCVLLPIQIAIDFVSDVLVTAFNLDKKDDDNEHCEEDWQAKPEGKEGDSK
jgi:hypothetical protein